MIFLQSTFTSLVHAHAGRTQVNQLDVLRLSSFLQKKKPQKQHQPTRQLLRRYNSSRYCTSNILARMDLLVTNKNNYAINIKFKGNPSIESYKSATHIVQLMDELLHELNILLDLKKLFKSPKNIILKRVKIIESLINKQDADNVMQEYCYMRLFTQNLLKIKDIDKSMFNRFKRDITRQSHRINWYGIRAEVGIAANLLTNFKGSVTKSESPDFILNKDISPVYLESTMAIVTTKKSDVLYKIGAAINKKNSKPYANKRTALCIDLTNIFHRYFEVQSNQESDLFNWINDYLRNNEIKYGAIVILLNLYLPQQRRCQSVYRALKLDNCSDKLVEFLDDVFPRIGKDIYADPTFSEYS